MQTDDIADARRRFLDAQRKAKDARARKRAQASGREEDADTIASGSFGAQTVSASSPSKGRKTRSEAHGSENPPKVRSDYRTHIGEERQRSAINGGGSYPASNGGRPPVWTDTTLDPWKTLLLVHLSEGKSLAAFCRDNPEGPRMQTWLELRVNDPTFSESYTRAREHGADALADQITDIADSVAEAGPQDSAKVNAARLRVDARKWVAAKLKPKAYADRTEQGLEVRVSGTVEHRITDTDRARALAAILRRQAVAGAASLPEAMRLLSAPTIEHEPAPSGDGTSAAAQDVPNG